MIDCERFTGARVANEYGVKISRFDVIHSANGCFRFHEKIGNSGEQRWHEITNATVDTDGFVRNEMAFWHYFGVIE